MIMMTTVTTTTTTATYLRFFFGSSGFVSKPKKYQVLKIEQCLLKMNIRWGKP